MSNPVRTHEAIRERWSASERAAHYGSERFRSQRARSRDPRSVARLLERYEVRGPVLDAPCGTGRLRSTLESRCSGYIGVDASLEMLRNAEQPSGLAVADARRLPFASETFEAVVSCRLLHHLGAREARHEILIELARVSSRLVIASFWDSASLHAVRRRLGLRRDESTRRALSKSRLQRELESAGLRVLEWRHSFRFVSQQTFFVAEKR